MHFSLLVCFLVSFLATFFSIPFWIRRAKRAGLTGNDMHKSNKQEIAEIGGITVVFGFVLGILTYTAIRTFYFKLYSSTLEMLAVLSTVLIITLIGIIDDILGWKIGLKQWQKPVLTLFAALPIMVINAGHTVMFIPFFGNVNLGFSYILFIIPLAIICASNGFNMLAGYNGLEAGLGILIISTIAIKAYISGFAWISMVALCMVLALVAFYIYNRFPAKIFPGDTLTYSVGALAGVLAIMGDMEKTLLILFIPFIAEFLLKARGKFKKESFAKLSYSGTLLLPYEKIYGLEHLMILLLSKIKKQVTENDVVYSLFFIQFLCVLLALR